MPLAHSDRTGAAQGLRLPIAYSRGIVTVCKRLPLSWTVAWSSGFGA